MLDQTFSDSFQVEQIVDEKEIQGQTHYLVKWVGYDHQENTWEPVRHMSHSKQKIKQWEDYKIKQLQFIDQRKTLQNLDLGPSISKNQPKRNFIQKSKNPYSKLLNDLPSSPISSNPNIPKTFFDNLPWKTNKKLQKAQRKKKQLQLFQQRLKSKPKVWQQYLVNQEQMIKKANQKIKQIVDNVYKTQKKQEIKTNENISQNKISNVLKKSLNTQKLKSVLSDSQQQIQSKQQEKIKQQKKAPLKKFLLIQSSQQQQSKLIEDQSTNFKSKNISKLHFVQKNKEQFNKNRIQCFKKQSSKFQQFQIKEQENNHKNMYQDKRINIFKKKQFNQINIDFQTIRLTNQIIQEVEQTQHLNRQQQMIDYPIENQQDKQDQQYFVSSLSTIQCNNSYDYIKNENWIKQNGYRVDKGSFFTLQQIDNSQIINFNSQNNLQNHHKYTSSFQTLIQRLSQQSRIDYQTQRLNYNKNNQLIKKTNEKQNQFIMEEYEEYKTQSMLLFNDI